MSKAALCVPLPFTDGFLIDLDESLVSQGLVAITV